MKRNAGHTMNATITYRRNEQPDPLKMIADGVSSRLKAAGKTAGIYDIPDEEWAEAANRGR